MKLVYWPYSTTELRGQVLLSWSGCGAANRLAWHGAGVKPVSVPDAPRFLG